MKIISPIRSSHPVAFALLGALLLAAFLRFWQLGQMPPGLYHDEAYNGLDALSLLQGKTFPQFYEGWELYAQDAHAHNLPVPTRWPVFFEGNYGREPLHIYLMALSIRLFGATPWAIRAVPAAAGILAVWTTYLAAKAIFHGQKPELANTVPLLAAFTLAILFPAVHFSRFGLRMMLFVPVETLAVYFFWRGVKEAEGQALSEAGGEAGGWGETVWFALAGVMLGLGLYVYAAARLLPLLFVGFVLFWFWRDQEARRRFWWPVAVMMGASLVTALPILLFFARYPYFFVFRIAYVANRGLGTVEGKPWLTWLLNIGRTVRGLFWLGETHLRHNLPGRPYLDPVQAVVFVAGIAATLRLKWRHRAVFLFLWLFIMLLPTIMSGDAPHFGRLTGAAPIIAILIGLGIYHIFHFTFHALRMTDDRLRITDHGLQITLCALLIGASTFLTARDYFGRYVAHPRIEAAFYLPDWNLGQYTAAQPPETSLFLIPTQEEMATIYFALGGNTDRIRSVAGSGSLLPMGPPQTPTLYLLRPSRTQHLAALQEQFPRLIVGEARDDFIPALLPADALRPQPQYLTGHSWNGQIQLSGWSEEVRDQELVITLFWQASEEMDRDYTAYVHLLDDTGQLVAQLDRPPDGYPTTDWRPDEVAMDSYVIALPSEWPSGFYTLTTGFYYLPTLETLGETAVLSEEFVP
jgi:4-amino-4-deoxy-L-arabinose transferase-like glycosyltransferase